MSLPKKGLHVVVPGLSIACVMVGLRMGGTDAPKTVIVRGGAPAAGTRDVAWQLSLTREERRLSEPIAGLPIRVECEGAGGNTLWEGVTNRDGRAEMHFRFPEIPTGRPISIAVRDNEGLLAQGPVVWPSASSPHHAAGVWLPSTQKEGPLTLDLTAYGHRLVNGSETSTWVRVRGAKGEPVRATLHLEFQGIRVGMHDKETDARGFGEFFFEPLTHVAELTVTAEAEGARGIWHGLLPVAPSGMTARVLSRYPQNEGTDIAVTSPTPRDEAYAEVNEPSGRTLANVLHFHPAEGVRSATVKVPMRETGLFWFVTSPSAEGAESMGIGTRAEPFFVAKTDDDALHIGRTRAALAEADACLPSTQNARSLRLCLAVLAGGPFPRAVVFDSGPLDRARREAKRTRGRNFALGSLFAGALVEGLLLYERRGRTRLFAFALFFALFGFGVLFALVLGFY